MQHIPHANLEEKHVWPDLTLSGEDIHRAYRAVLPPDSTRAWDKVSETAKEMYENVARELNRELDARQAWFEGEDVTVSAVRCPQCNEMLQAEHAEGHACWLEVKPC